MPKNIIGLTIRLKYTVLPVEVKKILLGQKRKRGRLGSTSKAWQLIVNLYYQIKNIIVVVILLLFLFSGVQIKRLWNVPQHSSEFVWLLSKYFPFISYLSTLQTLSDVTLGKFCEVLNDTCIFYWPLTHCSFPVV